MDQFEGRQILLTFWQYSRKHHNLPISNILTTPWLINDNISVQAPIYRFFIGLTFFAVVILATAIILNLPFFTDEITIERQMYIDYLSNIGIKQHNLIQRSFPMFSRKHPASLHFDSLNLQSRIKLLEQMREFANQQSLNDEWINKQIEETNNELDKKLILLKEKYPDAFCALKFISNQETFSDQPHQFIHTPKTTENEVQTSE